MNSLNVAKALHQAFESKSSIDGDEWKVEAFDSRGLCYVTTFTGPQAAKRARDYALLMNATPNTDLVGKFFS